MVYFVLFLAGSVPPCLVLVFVNILEVAVSLQRGDAGWFNGDSCWFEHLICVQGEDDVFM